LRRDSKVERWRRDLDVVKDDVLGMHHRRDVYRTVARIVDDHGNLPPSLFFDYVRNTYGVTQAATIRRQAEVDPPRVVSLASLLSEIRSEPERLTRQRFVDLYDPERKDLGQEAFNEKFAGEASDHADPDIVQADIDVLRSTAETVERYVDRHIAHIDRKRLKTLPATFGDLDRAIDTIGELFTKYALLLTASTWWTLVPVPQHDWLAVFSQAWLCEDDEEGGFG
jgi:hypothetical protein